jgi:hypothetical protein
MFRPARLSWNWRLRPLSLSFVTFTRFLLIWKSPFPKTNDSLISSITGFGQENNSGTLSAPYVAMIRRQRSGRLVRALAGLKTVQVIRRALRGGQPKRSAGLIAPRSRNAQRGVGAGGH